MDIDRLSRWLDARMSRRDSVRRVSLLSAVATLGAVGGGRTVAAKRAGVTAQTNTTLGIIAQPGIFNAQTPAEALEFCGSEESATEAPDNQVAVSRRTPTAGINGGPGYEIGKLVDTPECAAGVIDFNGADGIVLDRLGFTVSGYCNAGAPRFNVLFVDNTFVQYGCTSGMSTADTFTDDDGVEWLVKRANLGANAGKEVAIMQIVHDETGESRLDDIAISNATLKGDIPAPPKKRRKRKCKTRACRRQRRRRARKQR